MKNRFNNYLTKFDNKSDFLHQNHVTFCFSVFTVDIPKQQQACRKWVRLDFLKQKLGGKADRLWRLDGGFGWACDLLLSNCFCWQHKTCCFYMLSRFERFPANSVWERINNVKQLVEVFFVAFENGFRRNEFFFSSWWNVYGRNSLFILVFLWSDLRAINLLNLRVVIQF